MFLADLEFARRLRAADMVLWWSPSPRPDLGGSEEDANGGEEPTPPQISTKGCYSTVVLEMEIADMAINAVLQSALVNEMEGSGSGSMAFGNASHNLDEYAQGTANASVMLGDATLSIQTFTVLKSMVRSWFTDKARAHVRGIYDTPANLVVDQFWRWISTASSCMFEPALYRFLLGLMRKTLLQLLAEFKRLGTKVVYADLNRVFLLTSKPDAASAFAFAKYLVTAANSHDLFRHIVIDVTQFWNYLAWMDIANFGGVRIAPEVAGSNAPTQGMFDIAMDWNIQAFLPPALQHKFARRVAEFIYELYKAKRSATDTRAPLRPMFDLNVDAAATVDPAKEKAVKAAGQAISTTLTRHLLEDVARVKRRAATAQANGEEDEGMEFPNLPGARTGRETNAALAFIKAVCEVYALASELSVDVQIMRRNLLDLIGVREFSTEAQFRNPGESLVVPMVSCWRCHAIRDVDLGRDADCLPSVDERGNLEPAPRKFWGCHKCGVAFDRESIEFPLIEHISRLVARWQTQDVVCTKCGQIKDDNLAPTCHCGGSFRPGLPRGEITTKLNMVKSVGEYHGLDMTLEYVSAVLSRW